MRVVRIVATALRMVKKSGHITKQLSQFSLCVYLFIYLFVINLTTITVTQIISPFYLWLI